MLKFVGNLYFLHFHDFKQSISTTQGHCNMWTCVSESFLKQDIYTSINYNCTTHVDCVREILLAGIKKLWWEFWWDRISRRILSSNILKFSPFLKESVFLGNYMLHLKIYGINILIWILVSLLEGWLLIIHQSWVHIL